MEIVVEALLKGHLRQGRLYDSLPSTATTSLQEPRLAPDRRGISEGKANSALLHLLVFRDAMAVGTAVSVLQVKVIRYPLGACRSGYRDQEPDDFQGPHSAIRMRSALGIVQK